MSKIKYLVHDLPDVPPASPAGPSPRSSRDRAATSHTTAGPSYSSPTGTGALGLSHPCSSGKRQALEASSRLPESSSRRPGAARCCRLWFGSRAGLRRSRARSALSRESLGQLRLLGVFLE